MNGHPKQEDAPKGLDAIRLKHEQTRREKSDQSNASNADSSGSSSGTMDDAPDAAVVAESNAAARAHLVVRDDKGRIVVPPLEDRSAVLAEVTRRLSVDEITAGCQQIHQLIADQSKHIERRMQIAKSKRKILSDAAELVRERQAELTKLKQVQATLSQPPPPLPPIATAESLAAKLDEQKQKLSKLNAKLEGRKAELTQRTEEAKQAATQLLKMQQEQLAKSANRVPTSAMHKELLDQQEKCKKLSEANESIHSHTMHDHEFLEGCKHKDLVCVKCNGKILSKKLITIEHWHVPMPPTTAS